MVDTFQSSIDRSGRPKTGVKWCPSVNNLSAMLTARNGLLSEFSSVYITDMLTDQAILPSCECAAEAATGVADTPHATPEIRDPQPEAPIQHPKNLLFLLLFFSCCVVLVVVERQHFDLFERHGLNTFGGLSLLELCAPGVHDAIARMQAELLLYAVEQETKASDLPFAVARRAPVLAAAPPTLATNRSESTAAHTAGSQATAQA